MKNMDITIATAQNVKSKTTKVALLTGGYDDHYVTGLTDALVAQGVCLDLLGGSEDARAALMMSSQVRCLNIRKIRDHAGRMGKAYRWLSYYAALLRYVLTTDTRIFHIVWNSKFEWFDRTLLMLCYKLLGKNTLLTVHNVNAGRRDGNDSVLNRMTLRIQYYLADRLFVHTDKMKNELVSEFGAQEKKIALIPFGVNSSIPDTCLTGTEARAKLGFEENARVILFFGAMRAYKGLKYLVEAFLQLAERDVRYHLILAGQPRKEDRSYLDSLMRDVSDSPNRHRVLCDLRHIPDSETEVYFKAADVAVLPYTDIFQSGVLFLAYGFGLPVVASDVGSMRVDVIEGKTGFLCRPCDSVDLARMLEVYFESDLYANLPASRHEIREWVEVGHSWKTVAEITSLMYEELQGRRPTVNHSSTGVVAS